MANEALTGFGPEQFTKMLENFRVPGLDVQALIESQRKNVEALTKATQVATQGATEVSQKQAEIVRHAIEQAAQMAREFKATDPSSSVAAQQEFVKKAFETAVANARELAEMVGRSNREAYEVIEKRVRESLAELRQTMTKGGSGQGSSQS